MIQNNTGGHRNPTEVWIHYKRVNTPWPSYSTWHSNLSEYWTVLDKTLSAGRSLDWSVVTVNIYRSRSAHLRRRNTIVLQYFKTCSCPYYVMSLITGAKGRSCCKGADREAPAWEGWISKNGDQYTGEKRLFSSYFKPNVSQCSRLSTMFVSVTKIAIDVSALLSTQLNLINIICGMGTFSKWKSSRCMSWRRKKKNTSSSRYSSPSCAPAEFLLWGWS